MLKKQKDFEQYKRYFEYYRNKFGLMGYEVFYKHKPIDGVYASINANTGEMVATTTLNSKLSDDAKPFKNVKLSAKHEALHLLISRLENNGRCRFMSDGEMYEAAEELVNKLCLLIPD